eukprot:g4982.t1
MGLGVENSTACTFFPREFSQDSKGKLFIHGLESALDHFAKKAHAAQVELMSSKETFLSTAKELRKAEAQLNFHKKQMHMDGKKVRYLERSYHVAHNKLYDAVTAAKQASKPVLPLALQHEADRTKSNYETHRSLLKKLRKTITAETMKVQKFVRKHFKAAVKYNSSTDEMNRIKEASSAANIHKSRKKTWYCEFGLDGKVEHSIFAIISKEQKGGLECRTPPFLRVGEYDFRLKVVGASQSAVFRDFAHPQKNIVVSPSVTPLRFVQDYSSTFTEEGGNGLWVFGSGFTAARVYNVSFSFWSKSSLETKYSEGLYDEEMHAVKILTPPMRAGFNGVKISALGEVFKRVPGVLPVHYGTRVHVMFPLANEGGEVNIFYAPPPTRGIIPTSQLGVDEAYAAQASQWKIDSVRAIIHSSDDTDPDWNGQAQYTSLYLTSKYGRYTWKIIHQISDNQKAIGIQKFEIKYVNVSSAAAVSKYTYDGRYELDEPVELSMRLAPEALAKANETYPFNIIG